jgi:DNA-binding transcriptional ArsR family regulator
MASPRAPARSDVFAALADPTRRALLDRLKGGEQPVGELARRFAVSLSAVSQHLGVLRRAGLVRARRAGRARYYRLEPRPLKTVAAWVRAYERFWSGKLGALEAHLVRRARKPAAGAQPQRRRAAAHPPGGGS